MADIDWPSTIPQAFQQDSFSEATASAVLRTSMDTGPTKVRRRTTSNPDIWSGRMILTSTELADFKTFYRTTSKYGSERFNFPNQYDLLSTVEARFKIDTGGEAFSITPDGDTQDWSIDLTLEVFV